MKAKTRDYLSSGRIREVKANGSIPMTILCKAMVLKPMDVLNSKSRILMLIIVLLLLMKEMTVIGMML